MLQAIYPKKLHAKRVAIQTSLPCSYLLLTYSPPILKSLFSVEPTAKILTLEVLMELECVMRRKVEILLVSFDFYLSLNF